MEISPDNWKAINKLFDEALDEEPARRLALLNERCEDENIRLEVLRLLTEHEQRRRFPFRTSLRLASSRPAISATSGRLEHWRRSGWKVSD